MHYVISKTNHTNDFIYLSENGFVQRLEDAEQFLIAGFAFGRCENFNNNPNSKCTYVVSEVDDDGIESEVVMIIEHIPT